MPIIRLGADQVTVSLTLHEAEALELLLRVSCASTSNGEQLVQRITKRVNRAVTAYRMAHKLVKQESKMGFGLFPDVAKQADQDPPPKELKQTCNICGGTLVPGDKVYPDPNDETQMQHAKCVWDKALDA